MQKLDISLKKAARRFPPIGPASVFILLLNQRYGVDKTEYPVCAGLSQPLQFCVFRYGARKKKIANEVDLQDRV